MRRKRLRIPCMYMHTLVHDLGVTESTYCAEPAVTGPRLCVSFNDLHGVHARVRGKIGCEGHPEIGCTAPHGFWRLPASCAALLRRCCGARMLGMLPGLVVKDVADEIHKRLKLRLL
jgi:hypothetical protein